MSNTTDLRTVGDRIDALIQEFGSCADPYVRERAEELVRLLRELYGAGLGKIRGVIRATDGAAERLCQRFLSIREPVFTEAQWDALQIPVGIAFFFFNTSLGRVVASYPSPAGATESLLPLNTWQEVVGMHPLLDSLAPDVEALLVYKRRQSCECYVVPIDVCYELVGRMRRHWKGLDGGEEAWSEIDAFFVGV